MDSIFCPSEVEEVKNIKDTGTLLQLIVWNDDVNTFDWVIKALIEICHCNPEQAEQCTIIIHFKGKYAVKRGSFETLKPMCEGLIDWGINATIE